MNVFDSDVIIERLREQVSPGKIRVSLHVAIIITVYEPKLPKWVTPFQRRKKL